MYQKAHHCLQGEVGLIDNWYGVSFWNVENTLDLVVMVAQPWECTKNHIIVQFKW